MPKINLCFFGWFNDVDVKTAINLANNQEVDISNMEQRQLIKKLNSGEFALSLKNKLIWNKQTN